MTLFIFDSYDFNSETGEAIFRYKTQDPDHTFSEVVTLNLAKNYNTDVFERALFLAFILIGTSYYKLFPCRNVRCDIELDEWQAHFFTTVYQEGLSQFAFENRKTRDDLAAFVVGEPEKKQTLSYGGKGILTLQSGGKDSLLVARQLDTYEHKFDSLYISSTDSYPKIVKNLGNQLRLVKRNIDTTSLRDAMTQGGLNGHVPVTYIVLAIGLLQTILDGKQMLVAAIGHEGEEPHDWIDDLPVNHQWSKTWQAEQLFADYVRRYVSPDMTVGSVLRKYSELKIAELFVRDCWQQFGHEFSSCNRANYQQGTNNSELSWCGDCPKCANSYLLFAPFLKADELQAVFDGIDLFQRQSLTETFKGLLGIDNIMKPFECVGEVDELRAAYHMAMNTSGYASLPFMVPESSFDYEATYDHQAFVDSLLK